MILLRSFVSPKEPKALAEFYLITITSYIAIRSLENSAFFPVGAFVGLYNSVLAWPQGTHAKGSPTGRLSHLFLFFIFYFFHLSFVIIHLSYFVIFHPNFVGPARLWRG